MRCTAGSHAGSHRGERPSRSPDPREQRGFVNPKWPHCSPDLSRSSRLARAVANQVRDPRPGAPLVWSSALPAWWALLGIDVRGDAAELPGAGAVILGALGYAGAALLYRRWLSGTPALAVAALMTAISSAAFLGPDGICRATPADTVREQNRGPGHARDRQHGVAYWLFYLLIDEAGAATASVITYVMPVVALFLGVGLLGVRLTAGADAGLILMALGAWLATRQRSPGDVLASVGRRRTRRRGPASGGPRRRSRIRSWPRRMTSTRAPGRSRRCARRASAGMVMVPLRGRTAILVSRWQVG